MASFNGQFIDQKLEHYIKVDLPFLTEEQWFTSKGLKLLV
jgi:hypothetical protein